MKNKSKKLLVATLLLVSVCTFFANITDNVSAVAADITLTTTETTVTIDWDESSSDPVDDYTIELSGDGGGVWYPFPHAPSNETALTFSRSIFGYNDAETPLRVRITTLFSNSLTETSSEVDFVIPSPFAKTTRFTVGAPELVIGDTARKAFGLNQWLDGSMGFFERNNQVSFVSANSGRVAKINLGEDGLVGAVEYTDDAIQNNTLSSDYASGGPVYYDEQSDRLLMFYHGEFNDPDVFNFYSYIGIASSTDGGQTFQDLGQIIRPDIDVSDPDRTGALDVGSGTYIINGDYFYVYHKDMNEDGSDVRMAVSRSPIAEVLAAAENGTTSTWLKYYNGSFSSNGIGGSADNIMPITPSYINWMDTVYVENLDEYVMAYTSTNDGNIGSMLYITTSTDGISWTIPQGLLDEFSEDEISFVTLTSPDYSNQRIVTGDTFELYRTLSTTAYSAGDRWLDARVERMNISFTLNQSNENNSTQESQNVGTTIVGNTQLAATGLAAYTTLFVACMVSVLSLSSIIIIRKLQ